MTFGTAPMPDHRVAEPGYLSALRSHGIEPVLVSAQEDLDSIGGDVMPSLVLVDAGAMPVVEVRECLSTLAKLRLPVIALVPEELVSDFGRYLDVDDFVLIPPQPAELVARAIRVLRQNASLEGGDIVRVGDLLINRANYEVSVKGRRINLRLKEYELLVLMATTPGRVYTRDALLNQIWGYNYLGGTRTVDVHVRRLRSNLDDSDHKLIETVWNVGYRFRDVGRRR